MTPPGSPAAGRTFRPLRLVFLGTPDLACPSLAAAAAAGHQVPLVLTQPDRRAGRGRRTKRGEVAALADRLGLPVLQPRRAVEALAEIRAARPDALVVLAFGQLLPVEILSLAPLGAINVHFSLLPRLRGAAPIQRAVLEGHPLTGVSTMLLDQGLDTGPLLLARETPVGPQETAGELGQRLAGLGAELLLETLDGLAGGGLAPTPQDAALATYAPRLAKAEGEVDWTRPARELDWHVRGMDPWPGAFTHTDGQTLKLFAPTLVLPGAGEGAAPGALLPSPPAAGGLLVVATGEGALGVGRVQAPGRQVVAARDFLRGARLAPGLVLGQA
ncbi:MAG: methionyl-tRNA formyltransferase [Deltaproteobacteria bacterium]|nr:methionyl-tRNA formyltransferase [Deltaproteobacteria bacterium]